MTPTRPYLLRAFFEWIVDNDMTPYLVVDALLPDVIVPEQHVENGRIILNISMDAVIDLALENEFVAFNAQFMKTPFDVYVPIDAVKAIYAKETGRGMFFRPEDAEGDKQPSTPVLRVTQNPEKKNVVPSKSRAHLSVVPNNPEIESDD